MRLHPLASESSILWDVVQEHLDEAGFCFRAWQAAWSSPLYTLAEVETGPEERLNAHLDGLVIAGPPAVGRLLLPALHEQDGVEPGAPQAAALALALLDRLDLLQAALGAELPEVRAACADALALSAPPELDRWLQAQLASTAPLAPRGELALLAARRRLPVAEWCGFGEQRSPEELRAALISARMQGGAVARGPWDDLLEHPDPHVAEEARRAGLGRGSRLAWARTLARAQAGALEALLDLARFGQGHELDLLTSMLDDPSLRVSALRALGYSGRVDLVPRLLEWVGDAEPLVARLAGEALSLLTGLDLATDPYNALAPEPVDGLPELEQDDLDADLVPTDDEDLPLPAVEAVRDWWTRRRGDLPQQGRVLAGEPWSAARVIELVERGPCHRRSALSGWLELGSGGAPGVDTRAWARDQRLQLDDLRRSARGDPRARTWA